MENLQQLNAADLRIGNLVEYLSYYSLISPTEWWELNVIDIYDLIHLLNSEKENANHYRPIQLTEEWLVNLKMRKCEGWDDMIFWREPYWEDIDNFFEIQQTSTGFYFNDYNDLKIDTVHDFQNIYYSLTKKELTYERPTN